MSAAKSDSQTRTKNYSLIALFSILAAMALTPAVWAAGNYYGPKIEGQAITKLEPIETACDGDDLIVFLEVHKMHGQYEDMRFEIVLTNGVKMETKWFDENNWPLNRNKSRSPGSILVGPLRVYEACREKYMITTYHRSNIGWWYFITTFGIFDGHPTYTRKDL